MLALLDIFSPPQIYDPNPNVWDAVNAYGHHHHSIMDQQQQHNQQQQQQQQLHQQHYYASSSTASSPPPGSAYPYSSQNDYQRNPNYPSSISSNDPLITQEEADLKRLRNTAVRSSRLLPLHSKPCSSLLHVVLFFTSLPISNQHIPIPKQTNLFQASARFRAKKKRREQSLERASREKKEKLQALEGRITDLEAENQWLKDLIIEKNDVRTEAERGRKGGVEDGERK